MNYGSILTKALIGGALGAGGGLGVQRLSDGKYGSPLLGAEIGAGLGAFLDALRQNKAEKNKNIKTRERLNPGLYYMERGIWGDQTMLKGTAFHQNARHGFYVGVYDEPPEGMETQRLPNGQYVVTFGGYPSPKKGSGIGDLYIAINGKSNLNGIDSPNDFRAIKSLFDSDLQRNSDYAATITPVDLDPRSSDKTLRKMYALAREYEDTSFGQYHTGLFGPANNCLTVLGSLTNSMGKDIDINRLPEQFGNLGGFRRSDIKNFKTLQDLKPPTPIPQQSAAPMVVAASYNFQKAARHVLSMRMLKQAKGPNSYVPYPNSTPGAISPLAPGVYYVDRGMVSNPKLSKSGINNAARHGFVMTIHDQKPEGVDSFQLPSGQWGTTMSSRLAGDGMNRLVHNGVMGTDTSSAFDPDAVRYIMSPSSNKKLKWMQPEYRQLLSGNDAADAAAHKMRAIYDANPEGLGLYSPTGTIAPKNSCLTTVAFLLNQLGVPQDKLPNIGNMGGVPAKDIANYAHIGKINPTDTPDKLPDTTAISRLLNMAAQPGKTISRSLKVLPR